MKNKPRARISKNKSAASKKRVLESCDTNILFYYLNSDCSEHLAAKRYLDIKFDDENFCICELALVELYSLIRNPKVLSKPLLQKEALEVINEFRTLTGWRVIDHPGTSMQEVWDFLSNVEHARRDIFDARFAFALKYHAVKHFATRNVKNFEKFKFLVINNPIDLPQI